MGYYGFDRGRVGRLLRPNATRVAYDAVQETVSKIPSGARVVDLGAGGRRIFPGVIAVDGDARCSPDIVCDLHAVPLPDGTFDVAFCTGTLEHVRDPARVGAEIVRLLRPGGIAFIDVPFLQGFHADPDDYWRWTLPGLRLFCTNLGLTEVSSGVHLGPGSSVTWILGEYLGALIGTGLTAKVGTAAVRLLCQPLLLLDTWLVRTDRAARIASGVFVVGRKGP